MRTAFATCFIYVVAVPGAVAAGERLGALPQYAFDTQQLSDRISVGVNLATGNLLLAEPDVIVSGALGPALTVTRSYNSMSDRARAFGGDMNMDSGADVKLVAQPNGDVDFDGPSGFTLRFVRRADGSYATPSGLSTTLSQQPDASYRLTENASQLTRSFTNAGQLTAVEDRNGRRLTYNYNADGTLASITDLPEQAKDLTRSVTFGYDAAKRIRQVADPAGRQHTYSYDAAGNLATHTNPDGKVSRYRHEAGRMTLVTTTAGRITKIAYHPAGDPAAGRVRSVMRVTNPTAAETSWTGPTTSYAYALGADGAGTVNVTDPRGGVWTYTVDNQARVTKTHAPTSDGQRLTSSSTWSTTSKVNQYTAPGTATNPSATTTFGYDADDNPSSSTTPAGAGTLYTGAKYGESPGATAPGGRYLPTTMYGTQDFAATAGAAPGGPTPSTWTGLEYSAQGNLKLVKRSSSLTASVSIAYVSETKGDPGAGRIASTTDPNGNITRYGYDTSGNLITMMPPAGETVYDFSASAADRALNRLSSMTDAMLQKQTHTYDALDRLKQIHYANSAGTMTADVYFDYDADGNLTQRRAPSGTTSYQYDTLGRRTYEDPPGPGFVDPDYDATSNLTSLRDESGTVNYSYKPNNRLASISEPGGSCAANPATLCTTYSYDDSGPGGAALPAGIARTVTQRLANGIATVESIDGAGRLVSTESRRGATTVQRFTYQYQYANGREMMLRSREVDSSNKKLAYTYDSLDRLSRVDYLDASGTVTDWRAYNWDRASNRTAVYRKPRCGKFTENVQYTYNSLNQVVSLTAPGHFSDNCAHGTSATWTYDANGNEVQHCSSGTASSSRTVATGHAARSAEPNCTTPSTYNVMNQLTSHSRSYGGPGQSELTSENGAGLTNSFLGILSHGGSTYFTREDGGKLVSMRTPAAAAPKRRQYYLHDSLGSVRTVTDENGAVVNRIDYGPFGEGYSPAFFGFAGGRQSANGRWHFGERFYDPTAARWTQQDPINQVGELREANRYAYVGGDPVNLVDPTGQGIKDTIECGLAIGGLIGGVGAGAKLIERLVDRAGSIKKAAQALLEAKSVADVAIKIGATAAALTPIYGVLDTCGVI